LPEKNDENFQSVVSALENYRFDVVMIWSPKHFPKTRDQFDLLAQKIQGKPVFYWEGDPWTRSGIKSITEQMNWWAGISQVIFSTVKVPHTTMFRSVTAAKIVYIPNTYCHIQFKDQEIAAPPFLGSSKAVVMIGSQTAKIPFLYGTPSSGVRFLAGTSLKLRFGRDFHLFGKNWPKGFSSGAVKYSLQAKLIREFSLSANWDNFVNYESYASDRLPISLIAGRVHVTSSHPGENYYGGEDIGLIQVGGLRELHKRIEDLREIDPLRLSLMGLEAHNWARHRLSHREAARFMFSHVSKEIPKPRIQPWIDL
jgi:hypothetical protein